MAQAVSSLHYNRNESGYAVAAGEYDSEASIAGGMQFRTSQDSAVTVSGQLGWQCHGRRSWFPFKLLSHSLYQNLGSI
ncbi:Uncharacterised protein [Serratia fonticola]|uniref:Uncharacterized protein n=1 Tax=Serratia fonticola TaxID=47917 RepID=A0A4U9TNQ7_SERFO|nr:Uncharacterised protein [Serratia fonticola]